MNSEMEAALTSPSLSAREKSLIILWGNAQEGLEGLSTYGLSKKMLELRIGNPNRAQLEKDLNKSSDVIKVNGRYMIRAGSSNHVRKLLENGSGHPVVDMTTAYIPKEIWGGTRTYIEKVAVQLCGCWEQRFYDAAAVMLRRLAETLLVEAYEALRRRDEITHNGNPFLLGDLVDSACGQHGLSLSREAKAALREIKEAGNRSAHNLRTNAVRPELERIRSGARTVVEELLNIARLKT